MKIAAWVRGGGRTQNLRVIGNAMTHPLQQRSQLSIGFDEMGPNYERNSKAK